MPDEGTQGADGESVGASTDGQGGGQQGRTFTQEQLNKAVEDRLSRERAKYKDYDDLQARAARADELEQASLSESEKLRGKFEREAQRRAEADERAKAAVERGNALLMRSAVVTEAAARGAADPTDVWTLLDKSVLSIDDSDVVQGVSEAVQQLLGSKPHLLKRAGGFDSGSVGGSSAQGPSMNDLIRQGAGFGR